MWQRKRVEIEWNNATVEDICIAQNCSPTQEGQDRERREEFLKELKTLDQSPKYRFSVVIYSWNAAFSGFASNTCTPTVLRIKASSGTPQAISPMK